MGGFTMLLSNSNFLRLPLGRWGQGGGTNSLESSLIRQNICEVRYSQSEHVANVARIWYLSEAYHLHNMIVPKTQGFKCLGQGPQLQHRRYQRHLTNKQTNNQRNFHTLFRVYEVIYVKPRFHHADFLVCVADFS